MKLKLNKKHEYKIGKRKFIAVTEFINLFFEKFNEKEIARKLASYPINKQRKQGVRYYLKRWAFSRAEGTKVHKEVEDFIKNKKPCIHPKAIAAQKFIEMYLNKEDILSSELMVYSEELGLAGTIDCLRLDNKGNFTIIDWKTNDSITNKAYDKKTGILPPTSSLSDTKLNRYSLQLNIYKYILENDFKYNLKINNLSIVHLTDNSYSVIPIPDMQDVVKEMINYEHTKHLPK